MLFDRKKSHGGPRNCWKKVGRSFLDSEEEAAISYSNDSR